MIASGGSYYKIANGSIDSAGLPSEYQQVEYIKSSGTQYIDTGLSVNYNFKIDLTFYQDVDNNSFQQIFGIRGYGAQLGLFIRRKNDNYIQYDYINRSININRTDVFPINTLHNVIIDKNKLYVDDNLITTVAEQSFDYTTNSLFLMANNNKDSSKDYAFCRLCKCKMWDNGTLARNFIPCYRISDNVIGMYDTVNDVFYTNQGTGTFLKGPNVYNRYKIENVESIYHIRGTATDNFEFTLKYIDRNNNITTVTEHAVIDGNGKWDVSYSGKQIKELNATYKNNTKLKTIEFTESMSECTSLKEAFSGCSFDGFSMPNATFGKVTDISGFVFNAKNIKKVDFSKADFSKVTIAGGSSIGAFFTGNNSQLNQIIFRENETFESLTNVLGMFGQIIGLTALDIHSATFENVINAHYLFWRCNNLQTLHIDNAKFVKATRTTDRTPFDYSNGGDMFQECSSLQNLFVPQSSTLNANINLRWCPLSYESMLRVAGWLKNLTGQTALTIVFRSDTYNALTAEQKAELEGIIVTQKGWNLATA